MAEESAKLRIPYIAAAQAQKHVTHNEAMTLLDTLVQLSVKDKDLTAPPGSPAEGDCYIVAGSGGTATGAWIGWEKRIARFIDGEWRSYLPGIGSGAGWLAWVVDEAALYAFNGTNWILAGLQLGQYLDFAEISPPSTPGADVARLYAKDVGGVTKLAFKDHAGTETVLGAGGGSSTRELLTAARTYYVRTDGSDSNTGLVNSSGGAFLTLQKAIDTVASLDLGIFDVTIQLGNGSYTGANVFKTLVGAGQCIILGDTTTPSNVVISTTAVNAFAGTGFAGKYSLRGLKITTTTSGVGINISGAGAYVGVQNMEFGACVSSAHMLAGFGAFISIDGNYAISGNSPRNLIASGVGAIIKTSAAITVTLSGTPAFSAAFAVAEEGGEVRITATTFSGSATGTRYSAILNGVINTNGAGVNFFPGNAAGSTATGGQYN